MSPNSVRPPAPAPDLPDATGRSDAADDLALRRQLRALPPWGPVSDIEALSRRVLAQWREQHDATVRGQGRGAVLGAAWKRRPWLVASAGLVVGLAFVAGLWLQRGDPVLDDLLRPDVLSQMAAGEM